MTIPIPRTPRQRRLTIVAWYAGSTLLAVVIAIVMINSVKDPTTCSVTGLQFSHTTQPNPLDLLTKPMPTPGAADPIPTDPTDGNCP